MRALWRLVVFTVLSALSTQTRVLHAQGPSVPDEVDPEVLASLDKMGAYLRTLKVFQVKADITTEDVLVNGQKVQYASASDVLARIPDRFRISLTSDRQERVFLFDGNTLTLWAPRMNFYGVVPAPPTIRDLVSRIGEKYGIELPLADLFSWGDNGQNTDQITGAVDLGPSAVDGVTCEQYAFRQPGMDWQIWIQLGDFPLPRKIVATTTTDEARPQYTAVYTWNLAPSFNNAAFVFDPPPDAKKITVAELKAGADSAAAKKRAPDTSKKTPADSIKN